MELHFEKIDHVAYGPEAVRAVEYFQNGYGISVISHNFSYGGPKGLYELAVLYKDKIVYDTPITSDVCGWLELKEVYEIAEKVASLPSRQSEELSSDGVRLISLEEALREAQDVIE